MICDAEIEDWEKLPGTNFVRVVWVFQNTQFAFSWKIQVTNPVQHKNT
jgi:hypothetical protein